MHAEQQDGASAEHRRLEYTGIHELALFFLAAYQARRSPLSPSAPQLTLGLENWARGLGH